MRAEEHTDTHTPESQARLTSSCCSQQPRAWLWLHPYTFPRKVLKVPRKIKGAVPLCPFVPLTENHFYFLSSSPFTPPACSPKLGAHLMCQSPLGRKDWSLHNFLSQLFQHFDSRQFGFIPPWEHCRCLCPGAHDVNHRADVWSLFSKLLCTSHSTF